MEKLRRLRLALTTAMLFFPEKKNVSRLDLGHISLGRWSESSRAHTLLVKVIQWGIL
jgi:hypothetical protein